MQPERKCLYCEMSLVLTVGELEGTHKCANCGLLYSNAFLDSADFEALATEPERYRIHKAENLAGLPMVWITDLKAEQNYAT